jgi:hypothetical protein
MAGLLRLCLPPSPGKDWAAYAPPALYALGAPVELCEAWFLELVDIRREWEEPELQERLRLAVAIWPHCDFWAGKICRYLEETRLGGGRRFGVRARLDAESLHLVAGLAAEAALATKRVHGYVTLLEGLLNLGGDPIFAAVCAAARAQALEKRLPAELEELLASRLNPGDLERLVGSGEALLEGLSEWRRC